MADLGSCLLVLTIFLFLFAVSIEYSWKKTQEVT